MRNKKKLLLKQLDKKISLFKGTENIEIPQIGWIKSIRVTLNMTLSQLAKKLGITRQAAGDLEKREASGSVTIKTLQETAKALEMHFVYAFVPIHESVEKLVEAKAQKIARKIVLRTNQNMALENQGNSKEHIKQAVEELADELKREMKRILWD